MVFTYLYGILNSYIILQYLHGIHIFVWILNSYIILQYLHGIHIFVWNIKQLHNTAVFTWYSHICMEY